MAGNKALNKAAKAKQDEFYTQLSDIEYELKHYKQHFKGKVILCNCDDPFESNFFKYFAMNFNALGLKKLMATCYVSSPVSGTELPYYVDKDGQLSLFPARDIAEENNEKKPYKIEITEVTDENKDGRVDLADVEYLLKNRLNTLTLLNGDGDFRSDECIELLKEADIVVTNPPFSLFREYIAQLIEYNKHFIVIGNQNAITYKEVFPLFMENKIWLGYKAGDMAFTVPDDYKPRETRYWVDEHGQKWRSMGNICWYTNLDIQKRHEDMILYKHYNPDEYPRYDNYDAIEVSKTAEIPCDYFENMGVPITYMGKHNPDQFEIVGADYEVAEPIELENGKRGTGRFYLKNSQKGLDKSENSTYALTDRQTDRQPDRRRLYSRIVIRRKL